MATGLLERGQDYLGPAQAGRRLGVTPTRVKQLIKSGQLAATVTPLGHLLRREDVERLVAQRQERARCAE